MKHYSNFHRNVSICRFSSQRILAALNINVGPVNQNSKFMINSKQICYGSKVAVNCLSSLQL